MMGGKCYFMCQFGINLFSIAPKGETKNSKIVYFKKASLFALLKKKKKKKRKKKLRQKVEISKEQKAAKRTLCLYIYSELGGCLLPP
jgi:hypothetical protein